MRVLKSVSVGSVLLLAILANGQQKNLATADVSSASSIARLEKLDALAAKANDVELMASLWTDDGVLIQPLMPPVMGRANIRALLQQQKRQAAGVETLAYEEDWKELRIHGDNAFEWGIITVNMRLPNGKEVTQAAYAARVLVRCADSSWRFARAIITPAPPTQNNSTH